MLPFSLTKLQRNAINIKVASVAPSPFHCAKSCFSPARRNSPSGAEKARPPFSRQVSVGVAWRAILYAMDFGCTPCNDLASQQFAHNCHFRCGTHGASGGSESYKKKPSYERRVRCLLKVQHNHMKIPCCYDRWLPLNYLRFDVNSPSLLSGTEILETDFSLLVGLSVAVAVFLLVTLSSIRILRKKGRSPSVYTMTNLSELPISISAIRHSKEGLISKQPEELGGLAL